MQTKCLLLVDKYTPTKASSRAKTIEFFSEIACQIRAVASFSKKGGEEVNKLDLFENGGPSAIPLAKVLLNLPNLAKTVADPGFPVEGGVDLVGGRGLPRQLRFENFVCQNERIWTLRGDPRSANVKSYLFTPGALTELKFPK